MRFLEISAPIVPITIAPRTTRSKQRGVLGLKHDMKFMKRKRKKTLVKKYSKTAKKMKENLLIYCRNGCLKIMPVVVVETNVTYMAFQS